MSEPVRQPREINDQYQKILAEAGDRQFKIQLLNGELQKFNQSLLELSKEFKTAELVHGKLTSEKLT